MKTVDVLHAFWVPQFAGKRDVFPNRETRIWFTAKEAGEYPGACAEFAVSKHARMLFYTVARTAGEFTEWVTRANRFDFIRPARFAAGAGQGFGPDGRGPGARNCDAAGSGR